MKQCSTKEIAFLVEVKIKLYIFTIKEFKFDNNEMFFSLEN